MKKTEENIFAREAAKKMRRKNKRKSPGAAVAAPGPKKMPVLVHSIPPIMGHSRVGGETGPLGRFLSDGKLMLSIVRDYVRGSYRQVPWWSVAAVTAALLYVLNPLDLVPDFLPGFGYIDDAAVVAACLRLVEKDLRKYREWRDADGWRDLSVNYMQLVQHHLFHFFQLFPALPCEQMKKLKYVNVNPANLQGHFQQKNLRFSPYCRRVSDSSIVK